MTLKKLLKKSVKAAKNGKRKLPTAIDVGLKMDREGNYILPAKPGECADLLYTLRERRLEIQHQLERFEKAEGQLRDFFINTLPKSSETGCAGSTARVQIETKVVPQTENWSAVYQYITKNNAFELLQKRLNEGAVKEYWDEGVQIPGVTTFIAKKVSCTKL